jgi:hypothetical protein
MVVNGTIESGPFCTFHTFYLDEKPIKIAEMMECPMAKYHQESGKQQQLSWHR